MVLTLLTNHVIEYRVQERADSLKWHEREVHTVSIPAVAPFITPAVKAIANAIGKHILTDTGAAQVRWNWKGSSQGHYILR